MGEAGATDTRANVVGQVCERIIAGESIAAIFRDPGPDWPHYVTFWRWLAADEILNKQVADAQLAACGAMEDRLIDVSRETRVGEIVTESFKGTEIKRVDMVDRSRLEADSIKWVLARRYPKRYGDRTTLAGDADNPLIIDDSSSIASRLLPELAAGSPSGTAGDADTEGN
jgi:hypothetical protein